MTLDNDSCPTLLSELEAARKRARQPASGAILRAAGLLGLPGDPPWGIGRVSAGKEFYQPEPAGPLALILPAIERSELIDLVAVSLRTGAVRTRYGIVRTLGADACDYRCFMGEAVPVFDNATSWLRHGGDGLFIVDWQGVVTTILSGCPALVCQTPALAQRIKREFERANPMPPLLVSCDQEESRNVA